MLCAKIAAWRVWSGLGFWYFSSIWAATSAMVCMSLKHLQVYALISAQVISKWLLRKHGEEFWTVFSMVVTVASVSGLPELYSFVVLETLYRMRKIRKMGHFNFPNQKSPEDEKRCITWAILNVFLYGWHSAQYLWSSKTA